MHREQLIACYSDDPEPGVREAVATALSARDNVTEPPRESDVETYKSGPDSKVRGG